MRPLLTDLTGIMIWTGAFLVALAVVARYLWRRGKRVEEP
jgi:hypothetical protein